LNQLYLNGNKIYYTATSLNIPKTYSAKNIPVYKGASLKVTFTSQPTTCTLTAKTQKYLDIPIETSGVAEFQMKDLLAISYNDIPNFNPDASFPKDYFECSTVNPFIQNFYFNISSSKVVGMGANCIGSTPSALNSNSGQQYLGLVPVTAPINVNNADGFTKIQIFRDDSGVKDITLFKNDDSAILASTGVAQTGAAPTSLYDCDSNPNCQELSCNGGKISGIKAQHDSSSIKALSIICSENYVPVPTTPPTNSCTLYGRIINPDDSNLSNIQTTTLSPSEDSKIISLSKIIATPTTLNIAGNYVKKAYLGLQTYANSSKKSLTNPNPECKIPLDIPTCLIGGTTSCVINPSDVKKSWLYGCYNGDGLNGIKVSGKAGTGGGGGGNNSKATRVKNGYLIDSAEAGKNGESYINPEFGTIKVADYLEQSTKGKGGIADGTSGSDNGSNGYLELSYDNTNWYSSSTSWVSVGSQAIVANENTISSIGGGIIYYRINTKNN
jgi:hypothetical protein